MQSGTIVRSLSMKILISSFALIFFTLTGCDRTPGVRTSQSAGGPGNAPETERSPVPEATPVPGTTP